MKILVVNGPNLNLLGRREPGIYGTATLADLEQRLTTLAKAGKWQIEFFQSNHEGALIDRLQTLDTAIAGIILNAGGLTHTSVSLRDAVAALSVPVVEVHLSNIFAREEFRQTSLLSSVCRGIISGLGFDGYEAAFRFLTGLVPTAPTRRKDR